MCGTKYLDPQKINITTLKLLLEQHTINVDELYFTKGLPAQATLLHIAVLNKDLESIEYLITKYADININVPYCKTALHIAKDVTIFKKLLQLGADINIAGGSTVLLVNAIEDNLYDIAKYLIEQANADVNAQVWKGTYKGERLLHIVTERGDKKMVNLFLDNNVDINARNLCNETALMVAVNHSNLGVFKLLLARGADIRLTNSPRDWTILHGAIIKENVRVVEYLLSLDQPETDITSLTNARETLLHWCIYNRPASTIESILLDAGVNVCSVDSRGRLVIDCQKMRVYRNHNLDIEQHIVKLISAGFNVCQRNRQYVERRFEKFSFKCRKEVAEMKLNKVGDSNITFFDVLSRDLHYLAVRLKCVELDKVIDKTKLRGQYSLYGGMLFYKLSKVNRRIGSIEKIEELVEGLLCDWGLPYNFVRNLWAYFENSELKKLISCFFN